jgi:hypothetical protein
MIKINRFPVIIFSSPRTGGTAFGHHLAKNNPGIKFFNENISDFIEYSNKNKNCIIKVIGRSLSNYPNSFINYAFSKHTLKIKIQRKSLLDQIASFYVARKRQWWEYYNKTPEKIFERDIISIDEKLIDSSIHEIKADNLIISKIDTDFEFFYEDIPNFDSPTIITPHPINYDEIKQAILSRINYI